MGNAERNFRAIGAIISDALDVFAAGVKKFAEEVSESAARVPDRDYWRGYTDAMHDMDERERAKQEEK